jgi:hypothetical protein
MVLQKSPQSARVWGYSSQPGQNVTVTVSGQKPVRAFSVDYPGVQGGVWTATLAPQNGPGPVTIEATDGQNKISLSDVLFGDVWICSGQSNMEFTLDMVSLQIWTGLLKTLIRFNHWLMTDDTNKKIDAWIDIYFLTYFQCKLYK